MLAAGSTIWQNLRTSFFCRPCPRPQTWNRNALSFVRSYAAKAREDAASLDNQKPKPKTATQLRRSASASLPFRVNPTPTRSEIQPISILTTAERFLLPNLRSLLPKSSVFLHGSLWIPKWNSGGKTGEVFVFENGSLVCWGLDEADALAFARRHFRNPFVEVGHLVEPETEDLEFVTDPNEQTRLQGDLIILGDSPPPEDVATLPDSLPDMVLPKETLLARYSFSQALARSSALSALETALDSYLSSVSALPVTLAETGSPGLRRRELIMKLGELLKFRQGLNLNRENYSDTPDLYWGEPVLETYFTSMTDALDMKQRTKSVNDKITYAAEVQSVLRELLAESSGHRMELIIIALIAVEVVICLIRDGPELWHMLPSFTSGDEKRKTARSDSTVCSS